jgi:hypothetical protein
MFAAVARSAARCTIAARPTNAVLILRRQFYVENTGGQNIPFSTKNRKALAIKFSLYCGVGFVPPFIAAAIMIKPAF